MTCDFTVSEGVGVITFNRPDVLNAFNDELGAAVLESLESASDDNAVRCIVLTGAGRAFSSGEDLGALSDAYSRSEGPDLGDTLRNRYNPLVRAIRAAPKPVVASLNGVAAGAGASIALACDFRVASEHAKLVFAFIKVGLVPDSGALWFLSKIVGSAKAWELGATGDPVSAQQALSLGLVSRVYPPAQFDGGWRIFARELASGPTRAYAITKGLINSAAERSLDDQLEAEIEAQTEAGRSRDHVEGVAAFLEKRRPRFEGR
jgi:2-(1,2-epoxy-1,2-dihydrophenyl)acetyl-CoA isomerase